MTTTTERPSGGATATIDTTTSKEEAQRIAAKINQYMAEWPTEAGRDNPFLDARVTNLRAVYIAGKTLWVPDFDRQFYTSLVFAVNEHDQVEQPYLNSDLFIERDLYPGESEQES